MTCTNFVYDKSSLMFQIRKDLFFINSGGKNEFGEKMNLEKVKT